ncbi:MAG: AlgP family protein [Pseudomonas sp.]
MPVNKKAVTTPLHLLQQLSSSLLDYLENACGKAQLESEELLAKLEKQRGKVQEKLHKSRGKLQDATAAGKTKALAKAKAAVAELEDLLDSLKERQTETRVYILQLKRDVQDSLHLAQGVSKVKDAAGHLLNTRESSSRDGNAGAANTAGGGATPKKAAVRAPRKVAAKPAVNAPASTAQASATDGVATKPAARRRTPAAAKPADTTKAPRTKPASRTAAPAATVAQPATPKVARKPRVAKAAKPAVSAESAAIATPATNGSTAPASEA